MKLKTFFAVLVAVAIAAPLMFVFAPLVPIRSSDADSRAGYGLGTAVVSPSFYFLGCGGVFDYHFVWYQAGWNKSYYTFAEFACKGDNLIWFTGKGP